MRLSAGQIAQATGGQWEPEVEGRVFDSLSTDTRSLTAGALFVALAGENFDAHDFLDRATEAGASALVVREDAAVPDGVPVLRVADTLRALGDVAAAWRACCPARRVAIVGSSGKTTTKDMLAGMLRLAGPTHASRGNLNNLIGLPLSLLELDRGDRWSVLELGMNEPGELSRLTEIADPDLLVLLNVGTAHIGQFGSLEALIDAKAEAVRALRPDVPILFDADSTNSSSIIRQWSAGRPLITFQVDSPAEVWAKEIEPAAAGYSFTLETVSESMRVETRLFGRYNVRNAVGAAAAAHFLGVDLPTISEGMRGFRAPSMRSEVRSVGGVTLIVDCYNANPDSMGAALESLRDAMPDGKGKALLVLGEMLELGEQSEAAHRELARQAAALRPEAVLLFGEGTLATFDACRSMGVEASHYETHEALTEALVSVTQPGHTVFFKGSRGNRLERAVEGLEAALNLEKKE